MPSLLLFPENITLGSDITLTCTSSGSPPDTFTWMKDGVPLTPSPNITTVTYTNTEAVFTTSYTISNVSVSDNGTYTCTVTNPIGSDNHTITVNIRKLLCVYNIISDNCKTVVQREILAGRHIDKFVE